MASESSFHKKYTLLLMIITGIIGTFITMGHKVFLKQYNFYTITYIDTVLTSLFLGAYLIYQKGFHAIHKDITTIPARDLFIFVLLALGVTTLVIIGRRLLKHNDMSYLGIMDTGIDVIVTILIAMLFLGEKLTTTKAVGAGIILLGAYIVNL